MHFRQHVAHVEWLSFWKDSGDLFSIHHQIASPAPKPIGNKAFPGQCNHLKDKVSKEQPSDSFEIE